MNLVDLLVILLAGLLAWRGWHRGMVRQAFEFGGAILGISIGSVIGPQIVSEYTDQAGLEAALLSLAVVFITLTIGQILGYFIGAKAWAQVRKAQLGQVDAVLGAFVGALATLVVFWLLGSMLAQGPSREVSRQLSSSRILRLLNDVAEPPDVLAYLQQYLDTSGFPQVFSGLPPSLGRDVKLPSGKRARAAVKKARESTVRIVTPACGGTQLGTGWIAADDTVVTNAHVVAGGNDVSVEEEGNVGAGVPGTVVLFDDELDLAIIRVDGLSGSVLDLDSQAQPVGTGGATIGYPGSRQGGIDYGPAAVQGDYRARGKDIYGRSDVVRQIYELRANVEQGDSGGPFVLPSGRVAGVVFAASTTDRDVGYALTGAEVADEIREGADRTGQVNTGRCTH
jgi:S1-C subfamily serine protease